MDAFTALADPVRRELLRRLRDGPARVVDLSAEHDISRPAISRHLRVLGQAALVSAQDRGRERHYSLEPAALTPVVELLAALLARPLIDAHALDGLDLEVRRTGREHRTTPPNARPVSPSRTDQQEDTA